MEPSAVFAALGDGTRLALVAQLSQNGPQSITELTQSAHVTRQAITKHLSVLAHAGLVQDRRAGRERIWEVKPEAFDEAQRALQRISEQWDRAIDRLRAHVED
jgi:DNA-binding transcriptional ArsR family regulator